MLTREIFFSISYLQEAMHLFNVKYRGQNYWMLNGWTEGIFPYNLVIAPLQNYLILIGQTGKLLVSDWLSAVHLVGLKGGGISSGIFKHSARLYILLFGIRLQFPQICDEKKKRGNQVKAWNEDPKAETKDYFSW